MKQLHVMGALDADGQITETGQRMAGLPLDPALARALIEAVTLRCVPEMTVVAAMLSVDSVFQAQAGGRRGAFEALDALEEEGMGDHVLYLRLFDLWRRNQVSERVEPRRERSLAPRTPRASWKKVTDATRAPAAPASSTPRSWRSSGSCGGG